MVKHTLIIMKVFIYHHLNLMNMLQQDREAEFLNTNENDNYNLVITGNKKDTIYVSGGNLNAFWKWF